MKEADHPGEMGKWGEIRGNPKVGTEHHGTLLQGSGLSILLATASYYYCDYFSQAKDQGHLLGNGHMTAQTNKNVLGYFHDISLGAGWEVQLT